MDRSTIIKKLEQMTYDFDARAYEAGDEQTEALWEKRADICREAATMLINDAPL